MWLLTQRGVTDALVTAPTFTPEGLTENRAMRAVEAWPAEGFRTLIYGRERRRPDRSLSGWRLWTRPVT